MVQYGYRINYNVFVSYPMKNCLPPMIPHESLIPSFSSLAPASERIVDRSVRLLCDFQKSLYCVGIVVALAACFAFGKDNEQSPSSSDIQFNRDIRPILSDLCFTCHGPDQPHRQADLRLDTREGASRVLKPGDSGGSELLRRMLTQDVDERMPPAKSTKQPTKRQIELIEQWIREGAHWQDHWSFAPLQSPVIPKALDSGRSLENYEGPRNPIDVFVQHELQSRGWTQTFEADKRTLIRRVTLDLTGLPPNPSDVENFLADSSLDAFEKVVDRLLRSEAFGERMAWDWLDAARYADSNGYQGDNDRTMWPWRDWVVKAFNSNLPFDEFTVWQIAGDLLPNATDEQKLATAFCRNHMINGEGGRIAEENRVDYVMDMTETVGTVWLGLTLNCCRCHDHKFDPIRQEEYYRIFAFFNQTPVDGKGGDPKTPPSLSVPDPVQQTVLESLDKEIADVQNQRTLRQKQLVDLQFSWEQEYIRTQKPWNVARPIAARAEKQNLSVQEAGFVLATGVNPSNDDYSVIIDPPTRAIAAIRLDAAQHPSMTKNGLSRADSGNFVLTSFELYRIDPTQRGGDGLSETSHRIPLSDALATFEQGDHKATNTLDDDPNSGWAVWQGKVVDRPHAIQFTIQPPLQLSENEHLLVRLKHQSQHANHNIGFFRLSTSSTAPSDKALDVEFELAIAKLATDRTNSEREIIENRHRQSDPTLSALNKQLEKLKDQRRAIVSKVPEVMIMGDRKDPRETFILNRGLYNSPGKQVMAGVPESMPPLAPESALNRLSFARWLVSNQQPLTPRVIVNRVWQQFFGIGLAKSVEDLGSQGEVPKYLELHNWLATEFRDKGWDMKHLIRLIVTSHTYRQSSRFSDSLFSSEDPENRFLGRGPRYRLPSWMIRDQALAASGLLIHRLGGPSVKVYQPEGIWEEATFGKKKYQRDSGEALYRRSLYVFWRRIVGPTIFFDNATRQVCTVKTTRTNTPLQALYTLNDDTFVEAARAMAIRALSNREMTPEERIDYIYQNLLARRADRNEHQVLVSALNRSRTQFASEPENSRSFLTIGESKYGQESDPIELASWTALCLAILNLDETLTKE